MRTEDPSSLRIVDLWTFRSIKSNKRYIVEIEHFSNNFFGIKFYWKGVANSKKRYSFLTNDNEPRTIVMSCIQIMLKYHENHPLASFGFVAAEDNQHNNATLHNTTIQNNCINKRFRFYRRMMLSLFSPEKFCQYSDKKSNIYLLLNKYALRQRHITLQMIEKEIEALYEREYSITPED